jgi:acyl carrier protein
MPLSFFVCMSSFAALYGSPGQGAYAAANCFLDALMHLRRRQSLHGLSINWGSWAGEGMAARSPQSSETFGVRPIPPARALAAFGSMLRGPDAQVCCIDADWSRLASRVPRVPSFLRDLAKVPVVRDSQETGIEARLQAAPVARRRDILAEFLQSEFVAVLRLPSDKRIDSRRGFFDYGLDSLMALEFRNRLQQSAGKPLPATLLFDCGNLAALTDYLADKVFSLVRFRLIQEPEPAEDDIEALLERELAAAESEGAHG